MKQKSTLLFGICYLLLSSRLLAQDPHFSQFYANRIYLNPAYAGFDPGKTVLLNFRNQWPGIPDGDAGASPTSYRTINATGDFRLPCFEGMQYFSLGLAGSLFSDDAGKAPLVSQGGGLAFSAARRLKFNSYQRKLDYLDIRIGTQLSMMQRRIDDDWFIYSNQLDPVYGLISDPSILNLRSKWYPNLNAGVMLNMGNRKFTFSSGISFSNVLEPNQALRDAPATDLLLRRYTGHLGATIETYDNVYLSPQARADFQSGFDLGLFSAGTYLQSDKMYCGVFYQWNKKNVPQVTSTNFSTSNVNHVIFNLGIDIQSVIHFIGGETNENRFVLGATYDLSLAGLGQQTTRGALEFSIRMFFDGGKKFNCLEEKRYNYKRCPIIH
jgi:type IX secretion system PorP/SprF family membrane protein